MARGMQRSTRHMRRAVTHRVSSRGCGHRVSPTAAAWRTFVSNMRGTTRCIGACQNVRLVRTLPSSARYSPSPRCADASRAIKSQSAWPASASAPSRRQSEESKS